VCRSRAAAAAPEFRTAWAAGLRTVGAAVGAAVPARRRRAAVESNTGP